MPRSRIGNQMTAHSRRATLTPAGSVGLINKRGARGSMHILRLDARHRWPASECRLANRCFGMMRSKPSDHWVLVLAICASVVCADGCTRNDDESTVDAVKNRAGLMQSDIQNVILISVDTLRADRVGCYGHDSIKTPSMDALAEQGWERSAYWPIGSYYLRYFAVHREDCIQ